MLIFTVGSAGSAVIGGRLVHRVGRRLVVIGSAVATLGLSVVALLAHGWTGPDTAAVLAAPLLVAGCGCGLVIPANQTLTLLEITRANAGLAAGIYETGQRIGTALGTTLSSALFFGGLATTGGDYHAAVGHGLATPAVLVGAAFLRHGGYPVAGAARDRSERRGSRVGALRRKAHPIRSAAVYC